MDRLMIDEVIAQHSVAGIGMRQDHVAPSGPVRFWNPAPELSDEFDCAYLDGGSASLHVHEEWQFAVTGLPSAISIGAFRRHIARPEDVIVVQPYQAHAEHGVLGCPRKWWVLHVAPSVIDRLYQDGTGQAPHFDSPVFQDGQSAQALAELLQANLEGRLGSEDFVNQVIDWLRRLLQGHAVGRALPGLANGARAPIERARAYLQAHATEPLHLSDLVAVAGVTTSHFVRSFSRRVGLPPKSYQTQLRLARARRLLAKGKPATWVAYECGFADQSHLSRRFKEFYGLTPGVFQVHYQAAAPTIGAGLGSDAA